VTPPKTSPAATVGVAKPKPVSFFADRPYDIALTPDSTLTNLLTSNVTSLIKYDAQPHAPAPFVPFSLILLSKDGKHRYAGVNDDAVCYSGSLLKVGVMYAAFEIRAAANRFLAANPTSDEDAFIASFDTALQAVIKRSRPPELRELPVPNSPQVEEIVRLVPGPPPWIEFVDAFYGNIDSMIVPSDDKAAGDVIDALGYSYINTALRQAGLSEISKRKNKNVIWISGDYSLEKTHFLGYVDTVNDGKKGRVVMNTRGMARLAALMLQDDMIDRAAAAPPTGTDRTKPDRSMMLDLLDRASTQHPNTPFDKPFILRGAPSPPFRIDGNKIGQGPIGPDPAATNDPVNNKTLVSSEVSILMWTGDPASSADRTATQAQLTSKGLTGLVVVCWQNYRGYYVGKFDPIANVVINTVKSYLAS
jgi:hypothetical protein